MCYTICIKRGDDMQNLTNLKEIETAVEQYGEVVVSKNEENNVIVMSMEEYKKRKLELDKIIEKHLLKSEDDIKMGRTRKAREVFKEFEEKYRF